MCLKKGSVREVQEMEVDVEVPSLGIKDGKANSSPAESHISDLTSSSSSSRKVRRRHNNVNRITMSMEEHEEFLDCKTKVNKIKSMIYDQKQFSWCASALSRRMLTLAMIFVPALSYVGATKTFVLAMWSFLNQVRLKIDNKSLSLMAPSKDTFRRDMKKLGYETSIALRRKIVGQCLCYACDASHKGGYHHMVKKISWFNFKNQ